MYKRQLFLQAKAQSLVNKAVEADEKVKKVKATPEDDVEGSMGWLAKLGLYMAQGRSAGQVDAQKLIKQHNEEAKAAAIKAAEEEKQAYLDEAAKLQDDLIALKSKKKLGDYVPDPKLSLIHISLCLQTGFKDLLKKWILHRVVFYVMVHGAPITYPLMKYEIKVYKISVCPFEYKSFDNVQHIVNLAAQPYSLPGTLLVFCLPFLF